VGQGNLPHYPQPVHNLWITCGKVCVGWLNSFKAEFNQPTQTNVTYLTQEIIANVSRLIDNNHKRD